MTINPCIVNDFVFSAGPVDPDYEIRESELIPLSLGFLSVNQGDCLYPVTFIAKDDLEFLKVENGEVIVATDDEELEGSYEITISASI